MIWLVFALLLLAVIAVMLFPILKGVGDQANLRIDYDIVVYRDQLAELEQDIGRGLLTEGQAGAARAEIHRRMLAAEDAELKTLEKPARVANRYARLAVIVLIAVGLPVGAVGMYSALGSPQLPGMPYAWRVANDPAFIAATSADNLQEQLKSNPNVAGYQRLGEMYFTAGNYDQAAEATRQAIKLGANDEKIWSELGEAVVMSNGGSVVPEAMQAFVKALAIEPNSERSRFYIGLAEAQIGNGKQAIAIWRDLEQSSPADAPWLSMLREHISVVGKEAGIDPASISPSPPSVETLNAAVGAMSNAMNTQSPTGASASQATGDNSQDEMIRNMVTQLAAKMEKSPNDAAGWQFLAHAYSVLGDHAKALDAINHAVQIKPNDTSIQATLTEIKKAAAASQ